MYNRYIRNDNGVYTRIPEDASSRQNNGQRNGASPQGNRCNDGRQSGGCQSDQRESSRQYQPSRENSQQNSHQNGGDFRQDNTPHCDNRNDRKPFSFFHQEEGEGIRRTLRKLLDRFHLEHVDTGDLLLLVLIFFLLQEDTDEELLIALGLLLIL